MKFSAIVVYLISLSIFLPVMFKVRLLEKPLETKCLKVTRRDCLFLGTVIILVAVGSTWLLNYSIDLGQIDQKIGAGNIVSLSMNENPAEFKASVYRRAAGIPIVLVLGIRILAYGRTLRRQP